MKRGLVAIVYYSFVSYFKLLLDFILNFISCNVPSFPLILHLLFSFLFPSFPTSFPEPPISLWFS